MLSNDEAVARFKEILSSKEGWQILKDSQFVGHIATFMAWALRASQFASERALQEYFLSTALNRSSISARAEDKGYMPRVPAPSSGNIQIKNNGANLVEIPALQAFQSNKGIPYIIKYPIAVQPGETVQTTIYQLYVETVVSTVSEALPFIEILFNQALTPSIHQVDVYVNEDGSGYVQWALAERLMNTLSDTPAYDLFYSHNGQIGIRFGNGVFGKIPAASSSVKCVLWLTSGNTVLLENLKLLVSGSVLDVNGQLATLEIKTTTQVSGGSATEETEELRRNLMYWPLYNDNFVWNEDYAFFVKRKITGILWLRVWGEAEAEQQAGQKSVDFINSIFISAYKTGEANLQTLITDAFASVKLFNRRIQWVAPVFVSFSLSITGLIYRKYTAEQVTTVVINALTSAYGKDSSSRRDIFSVKDVYQIITGTGYFNDAGAKFSVAVTGPTETAKLHEMLCVGSISCSLGYV